MDTMNSIPAHMRAGPVQTLEMLEAEKRRFAELKAEQLRILIAQATAPVFQLDPSSRAQLLGSTSPMALNAGRAAS